MRVNGLLTARLAAARLALPFGARRRAIEELFARTAAAFGCLVPPARSRGVRSRLREYASFTRARAEFALRSGGALDALDRRLYRAGFGLGARFRTRLGVRSLPQAMAAARLIYGALGIDFRGSRDGEVTIARCGFASVYTPRVCQLVSAMDRGLLAGLASGGELRFRERLTEGARSCRACLERRMACVREFEAPRGRSWSGAELAGLPLPESCRASTR